METIKIIIRFSKFLKPYWKKGLLALILMLLGVLLQLPVPFISKYLIDKVIIIKKISLLNIIGIGLIGIIIVRIISVILEQVLLIKFRAKVFLDIRTLLFDHIQKIKLSYLYKYDSGYWVARISQDINRCNGLLANTFIQGIQNILVFITGLICTFYINFKLTIISLFFLLFYGISLKIFNSRLQKLSNEEREQYAILQKNLQELVSHIFIIKAFTQEEWAKEKLVEVTKKTINKSVKLEILSVFAGISTNFITSLAPIILIWYGCREIIHGNLTLGGLVAFNSFINYLFGPTQALINLNFSIQKAVASSRRIFEILDIPQEYSKKQNSHNFIKTHDFSLENITFDNITFGYTKDKPILKNISFSAYKGEIIAIIGFSGIGKSTLCNLLLRFYEPWSGHIFINKDIDINNIDLISWRKIISIVPQNPFLFNDSIAENIKLGNLNASEDEIIEAAKKSYAHEFIVNLENGYNTIIGENGLKLSAGQRQRLALARAFIRNPQLLILDEITSNLDSYSEFLIWKSLKEFSKEKIIFIITHRLSSLENVDKIILMDYNKDDSYTYISAIGSHFELLQNSNLYKKLYSNKKEIFKNKCII